METDKVFFFNEKQSGKAPHRKPRARRGGGGEGRAEALGSEHLHSDLDSAFLHLGSPEHVLFNTRSSRVHNENADT